MNVLGDFSSTSDGVLDNLVGRPVIPLELHIIQLGDSFDYFHEKKTSKGRKIKKTSKPKNKATTSKANTAAITATTSTAEGVVVAAVSSASSNQFATTSAAEGAVVSAGSSNSSNQMIYEISIFQPSHKVMNYCSCFDMQKKTNLVRLKITLENWEGISAEDARLLTTNFVVVINSTTKC